MKKGQRLQSIYPLSPLQHGILFHYIKDKTSDAYFQQDEFQISGYIDQKIFAESWQYLIRRYDILRTNFVYQKLQTPRQIVFKEKDQAILFEDLREIAKDKQDIYLNKFKELDRQKGFDLTKGHLMRVAVFQVSDQEYTIIWSHHHIIMDGWCRGIIFKDFFSIYGLLKSGAEVSLPKVYPYSTFIDWLKNQDQDEARAYWRDYLAEYQNQVYPFGVIKRSVNADRYLLTERVLEIDALTTKKLEDLAKKLQVTLNSIFQTVWGILLQKYNYTDDVIFGAVVSGRPPEVEGIEMMIGLFINTVPVRIKCSPKEVLRDVVRRVHDAGVKSRSYDYLSLAEIQAVALKGTMINHIVVFENFPTTSEVNESLNQNIGFQVTEMEHFGQTNYDFNLRLRLRKELQIDFTYNSLAYQTEYIQLLADHLYTLLKSIVINENRLIEELDIYTEKAELLAEFNAPLKIDDLEFRFLAQFYQRVDRYPDKIAIEYGDHQITYGQLDQRSSQIANFLLNKGLSKGRKIGILCQNQLKGVISILGILKAGAIFVSLDPAYPIKRLQMMIEIADLDLIVSDQKSERYALELTSAIINQPEVRVLAEIKHNDSPRPAMIALPDDPVYIFFSSGSTGRPKGIVGRYESLFQFISWEIAYLKFTAEDRLSQLTSPSFDAYLRDIFPALWIGGTICIPKSPDLVLNPRQLVDWIDSSKISVIHCVPSLFKTLNFTDLKSQMFPALRYVCLTGERIKPQMLKPWYHIFAERIQLVNLYGPTETTLIKAAYLIKKSDILKPEIPFGKPIEGSKLIILDENQTVCGRGVLGEIYIRTAYGTHGYLNSPKLSQEKYLPNPFSTDRKDLLYRTGDLGRLLLDGNYEYAGRRDDQVKINGVRIELGEIENQLLTHPVIKEVAVITREDDDKERILAAYLEIKGQEETQNEFREYLQERLPAYMIPRYFVVMDKLPLTPNGKIDRHALPNPQTDLRCEVDYLPPTTEMEKLLAKIYSQILGVDKIGVHDDFFALGGHSLKIMELVSSLDKELGLQLAIRDLYKNTTISELAKTLALVQDYGRKTLEQPYLLFNTKQEKNIFCFPPRGGMGVVYQGLAQALNDVSVYGFDFITTEDFLERYVQIIIEIQQTGSYVFLGHSLGGSLAFELAKIMDQRGHFVSDIIMFDTINYVDSVQLTGEELDREVVNFFNIIESKGNMISEFVKLETIREELEKKVRRYTKFKFETNNSGQVRANIHYINAENSQRKGWQESSSTAYFEYAGFGQHAEMLSGTHLSKNLPTIRKILTSINW